MKKLVIAAGLLLTLGACTHPESQPPLEDRLSGKSGMDRVEALRAECIKEGNWGPRNRSAVSQHAARLAEICNKLADEAAN